MHLRILSAWSQVRTVFILNPLPFCSSLANTPKSRSFTGEQVFHTSYTRIRPSAYRFTPIPRDVKSACD
jgi:hypothetical protein